MPQDRKGQMGSTGVKGSIIGGGRGGRGVEILQVVG